MEEAAVLLARPMPPNARLDLLDLPDNRDRMESLDPLESLDSREVLDKPLTPSLRVEDVSLAPLDHQGLPDLMDLLGKLGPPETLVLTLLEEDLDLQDPPDLPDQTDNPELLETLDLMDNPVPLELEVLACPALMDPLVLLDLPEALDKMEDPQEKECPDPLDLPDRLETLVSPDNPEDLDNLVLTVSQVLMQPTVPAHHALLLSVLVEEVPLKEEHTVEVLEEPHKTEEEEEEDPTPDDASTHKWESRTFLIKLSRIKIPLGSR